GIEHSAPSGVGILVEGNLESLAPSVVEKLQNASRSPPVLLPRDLEVRNMQRASRFRANSDYLVQGIFDIVLLVSHVDDEKSSPGRSLPGQCYEFLLFRIK